MINFTSTGGPAKSKTISRRMFLLTIAKTVVFSGIIGRLIYLQINETKKYRTLSDKNRFREWRLAPQRGVIKDYFGNEIASNKKVYQLHITPENTTNINQLFFRLKNILNLSNDKLNFLRKKMKRQKPWEPIIVSENLSWSEFSRINLFLHELQGAEPIVSVARVYPDHSTSHIVGYVSEASQKDLQNKEYLRQMAVAGISVGKTGLEVKLDKEIIGKVGFQRYEVNAYGKRIRQIQLDKGQNGKNYTSTIDLEVQKFTSNLLKDVAAAVCVMDIYSGEIITMVSSPTYDPNSFVHGINNKDWKYLLKHRDKPLMNKAISGLYPPGSTIKTLVALSALENDIANTKQTFNCKGVIELYGEKFHCWEKKGHGYMNMRSAIKRSCDVYFYEIAGVSYEERFDGFRIDRDTKEEQRVFEKLNPLGEDYIFIHDDTERGFIIDIESDYKIIRNDITESVFHYGKVIENAKEFHCIESCIRCYSEHLDTKNIPLYHHNSIRPNILSSRKKWIIV